MNAAETTGVGFSFDALGKTWTLAPKSPGMRAKFSEWCKLAARANLRAQRAMMPATEYQEERELLQDRINKGDYDWSTPYDQGEEMGAAVAAFLNGTIGRMKFTLMLLEPHHGLLEVGDVVKLLADNPDDFNVAWRSAMGMEKNAPAAAENASAPPTANASNGNGAAAAMTTPPTAPA